MIQGIGIARSSLGLRQLRYLINATRLLISEWLMEWKTRWSKFYSMLGKLGESISASAEIFHYCAIN